MGLDPQLLGDFLVTRPLEPHHDECISALGWQVFYVFFQGLQLLSGQPDFLGRCRFSVAAERLILDVRFTHDPLSHPVCRDVFGSLEEITAQMIHLLEVTQPKIRQ